MVYDDVSKVFQFVHATFQTYICHVIQGLRETDLQEKQLSSTDIATRCFEYIRSTLFQTGVNRQPRALNLASYAARYRPVHAKGEPEESMRIQDAIISMFDTEAKKNRVMSVSIAPVLRAIEVDTDRNHSMGHSKYQGKNETFLHYVAGIGLATLCEKVLDPAGYASLCFF